MILRTSKHKGEAAHSLPEAIIAALVVGTMLVSLYAGFSSGFTIVQSAREELRATQVILERMESIRLYTWSQLLDTNNFLKPTFVKPQDASGNVAYSGTVVAKSPTAANLPGATMYRTNLLEVTVKVYWTNRTSGQEVLRSKQMQTYVARYGMQNYIP